MLLSMTGFGKAKKVYPDVEIIAEIHSVNKKFLDLHIKLPPEWQFFESAIRNCLSERVERGHITLNIQLFYSAQAACAVNLNAAYADSLASSCRELATLLGIKEIEPNTLFTLVAKERGVFQPVYTTLENSEMQKHLLETIMLAVDDLVNMKKREGELLKEDFQSRLRTLQQLHEEIALNAANAPNRYREKITTLLMEFVTKEGDPQERIAKEVALMADKLDISEELSRFSFHISHFQEQLENKTKKPVGKVLEFILQELLREINTIGSKSQDTQISKCVIFAKSEIEKMKEQVQNVE